MWNAIFQLAVRKGPGEGSQEKAKENISGTFKRMSLAAAAAVICCPSDSMKILVLHKD